MIKLFEIPAFAVSAAGFGFFGCLCFPVCANANEYDKVADDGNHRRARLLALGAGVLPGKRLPGKKKKNAENS